MMFFGANAINSPEACVQYALTIEPPVYPCIRVVLTHGTFVDLFEEDFLTGREEHAQMSALFSRAYAGGYAFSDTDRALLLDHLAPTLAREWEIGMSGEGEGAFDTISADFSLSDAACAEPTPVLLTQRYTGDHFEGNNAVFNWYLETADGETDPYETALAYRKADSRNPQIAAIVAAGPGDF